MARTVGIDFGSGSVAAIEWFQIDTSEWPSEVSTVQDSVLGSDGIWQFYPAIMVDAANNVALVYARSSSTEFASSYFATRLSTDPPNELRSGALLKAGVASLVEPVEGGTVRYGDYFGIAQDPDKGAIWMLGEYVSAADVWGAWVGEVAFRGGRRRH
jgi:hypothetical protein